MIAYFYGLHYDGIADFTTNTDYTALPVEYVVDLYILAKKYQVAELRFLLEQDVDVALESWRNSEVVSCGESRHLDYADKLVRYAKLTYPDHNNPYHSNIVLLLFKNAKA